VVSSTPWPHFDPGKDTVPILQEAGWAPGPVWTSGKSRPHRDSIPDCPAPSQPLYRLSYRAHKFIVIPIFLLRMRKFSDISCRENQNTFCVQKTFFETRAVDKIMWKYVRRGRPQMTIWRMRIAWWITKATITHTVCVILTVFPLQQMLHYLLRCCVIRIFLSYSFTFSSSFEMTAYVGEHQRGQKYRVYKKEWCGFKS